MEQELINYINEIRKINTYKTANGSWTINDNSLTIKVSELLKIINNEKLKINRF